VKWTRSRPLARPSRAFGFAKFLSPVGFIAPAQSASRPLPLANPFRHFPNASNPKRFKSCHTSRLGVSRLHYISAWQVALKSLKKCRFPAFPVVGRVSRLRNSVPGCGTAFPVAERRSRSRNGVPGHGTAFPVVFHTFPVVGRLSRMVGRGSRPFGRCSRSSCWNLRSDVWSSRSNCWNSRFRDQLSRSLEHRSRFSGRRSRLAGRRSRSK
jgi:hypothetical protein